MLSRAKDFTVKSAVGAKDVALNAKDMHKDLFVFQKSLRDMIKGMRNHREQEEQYITEALQNIRKEIKSPEPKTKTVALQKLTYLAMSGYDMSWASFHCVEVMSQSKLALKHSGYLAAQQSFLENTDVLLLIPNLLKKDLASSNSHEAGFALDCLANIMTPDLARDLVSDVFSLLNSNRGYLRKKAVLVLYKAFLSYPEALRPAFPRLTEKIEDNDLAVVSAVVTVLCELCIHNPQNYLPMAPTFYKLLQTSTNNWMTIKLVRIFGHLSPLEQRLGKKLVDPLTQIMTTTPAKSLLYECIRTVTHGLTNHTALVRLAVEKLREFIDEPDPNLKYLGLQALQDLRATHPRAVAEHKDTIFQCLHEGDYTIQTCALGLVRGMVNRRNLQDTVLHLMLTLRRAEQPFRDDVVLSVLEMGANDRYALLTDFAWYVNVLADLARVAETKHGKLIGAQLIDITARVAAVREDAVKALRPLVLDPALLETKLANATVAHALQAAAFITGEHAVFVPNRCEMVEALMQPNVANLPNEVQQTYVQALMKVFARAGTAPGGRACEEASAQDDQDAETESQPLEAQAGAEPTAVSEAGPEAAEGGEGVPTKQHVAADVEEPKTPAPPLRRAPPSLDLQEVRQLRRTIQEHLAPFVNSACTEVAERACHLRALLQLLAMAEDLEGEGAGAGKERDATLATCMAQLDALFVDELMPVSVKAQKRVPVPMELDLEAPIPAEILKLVSEKEESSEPWGSGSDDEDVVHPRGKKGGTKKKKSHGRDKGDDSDEEDDSLGMSDVLTRKSKSERERATSAARHDRERHVKKHSTFYLGGKDVKRTGPFRDKDYDKDDEEAEAELGVVTAQEVQPLEEMLEETAALPIPNWGSKSKKADVPKYTVMRGDDEDEDADEAPLSKSKAGGPQRADPFKNLDMDVLAPLEDGEQLPATASYPQYEREDMYGGGAYDDGEGHKSSARRRKHKHESGRTRSKTKDVEKEKDSGSKTKRVEGESKDKKSKKEKASKEPKSEDKVDTTKPEKSKKSGKSDKAKKEKRDKDATVPKVEVSKEAQPEPAVEDAAAATPVETVDVSTPDDQAPNAAEATTEVSDEVST